MVSSSESIRQNPIHAAIDATELRTDWHYTPPEHRVKTPLPWMSLPGDEDHDTNDFHS